MALKNIGIGSKLGFWLLVITLIINKWQQFVVNRDQLIIGIDRRNNKMAINKNKKKELGLTKQTQHKHFARLPTLMHMEESLVE